MLTAALFTTVNTWKGPGCPSTEEYIKNKIHAGVHTPHTHTHTHTYTPNGISSRHEKEGNLATCNNMDGLEGIMLNKIIQTPKDKYHLISLTSGIQKCQTHKSKE